MPDINRIGEFNDTLELGRLLQLALGCAVNCDHKEGKKKWIDPPYDYEIRWVNPRCPGGFVTVTQVF